MGVTSLKALRLVITPSNSRSQVEKTSTYIWFHVATMVVSDYSEVMTIQKTNVLGLVLEMTFMMVDGYVDNSGGVR